MVEAADERGRRVYAANARADSAAKAGAELGANAFLAYVHQAFCEEADKVRGALDLIDQMATGVFERDGGWLDAELPRAGGRAVGGAAVKRLGGRAKGAAPPLQGSGWVAVRAVPSFCNPPRIAAQA